MSSSDLTVTVGVVCECVVMYSTSVSSTGGAVCECGVQHKCEQYWPDSGSMTYGNIIIEKVDEEEYADFTIRTFNMTKVLYSPMT